MKLLYPAVFSPFDDGSGYTVRVPDLPGCVSEGDSLADAIIMGTDAASGWVLDELEDGNDIPKASDINDIKVEKNEIVNLLVLDMDAYAEKYGGKAVRKNITIPSYMNTYIEKTNLSLSKVVRETISEYITNRDVQK